jgi:hypothetical protein
VHLSLRQRQHRPIFQEFPSVSLDESDQAYPDKGLASVRCELRTRHATLYALDALTGKELYSSGDQIKSFNHFSGFE